MIIVENRKFANISSLHIVKQKNIDVQQPLLIFWHGFTSMKEDNLQYAYLLAEEGFRVILPDAVHHGERQNGLSNNQRELSFWEIVIQSIYESEKIKVDLNNYFPFEKNDVSMAGISMGAIITLGALTQYDWIKRAGSLMGTPAYTDFALMQIQHIKQASMSLPISEEELTGRVKQLKDFDLSLKPDLIKDKELFFWHGEKDSVVPIQGVKLFLEEFSDLSHIQVEIDADAGHNVSREGISSFITWMKGQKTPVNEMSS
ncbi:esterase [Salipaludibacillus sp. CF4.18]|uniref:esterase n=1 Tax=Salipaludibacillus sp. CF4.18 TaxID=3373081 RepID=UPI003EE5CC04